jgi:membrane-associated phospholipid phosphatase
LSDIRGLATFPSFHIVLAILTAWALYPVRVVGAFALALNGIVVVATLGSGGHYLVDVLGGGAIAIVLLAGAR